MKQAMENVAEQLKSAGTGWDRVARTTVMLVRRDDFGEMNRIYGEYFSQGKYPARKRPSWRDYPARIFSLRWKLKPSWNDGARFAPFDRPRSVVGHLPTSLAAPLTSGIPQRADIIRTVAFVR
jgi:hypothetical protein